MCQHCKVMYSNWAVTMPNLVSQLDRCIIPPIDLKSASITSKVSKTFSLAAAVISGSSAPTSFIPDNFSLKPSHRPFTKTGTKLRVMYFSPSIISCTALNGLSTMLPSLMISHVHWAQFHTCFLH